MSKISIPCGKKKIIVNMPEIISYEFVLPRTITPVEDEMRAIEESISHPIKSKRLCDMISPNSKIVIIVTDITRCAHEEKIVPYLLKELKRGGAKNENIKIVMANGTHRPNTTKEIEEIIGKDIAEKIKVINHNANVAEGLVSFGKSKKGIPVTVNKEVAEADIRISTGVIEPHIFAGYSGGVKSLAVGVAGMETIDATHNAKMLDHPQARLGVIEKNIFREFLEEAAMTVGLDFIVNVIQDGEKKIIKVVAGNPIEAHKEGVITARKLYEVKIERPADIVISVPGYPKDRNLYQATRAANNIIFGHKPIIKKGGTIIIPASCHDGTGNDEFYKRMKAASSIEEILEKGRRDGFPPEEHKAFTLAKILQQANIIITNTLIPKEVLNEMHLKWAETIDEALNLSLGSKDKNKDFHLLVMPYGVITLPVLV